MKKNSTHNFDGAKVKKSSQTKSSVSDDILEFVPKGYEKSTILNFEQFSRVWSMLPDYVKIRNPNLIYSTHTDGFNLMNLYNVSSEYRNEYKFSLLFIQTKTNKVFGAFIDDVIRLHIKGYIGSNECFVFTVKPEINVFYEVGANQRYLLGEMNYFQFGGEG